MTKGRRWLLGGAALVAAAGLAGYVYRVNREADQVSKLIAAGMLHGHDAIGVKPEAWSRVHVGMTMHDVEALLGEAPSKRRSHNEQSSDEREWWEYGYVSSIFAPVPDNRAYVVYFDRVGLVASIREPTQ